MGQESHIQGGSHLFDLAPALFFLGFSLFNQLTQTFQIYPAGWLNA
jgi:hypothetical protein